MKKIVNCRLASFFEGLLLAADGHLFAILQMKFMNVALEINFLFVGLLAELTSVASEIKVHTINVNFQVSLCRGALVTQLTREVLFDVLPLDVIIQLRLHLEKHDTLIAENFKSSWFLLFRHVDC
jgi:hypothetical protein